ncbi:MAG: hypothetical protein ACYCTE_15740, partial [Acidimicrobiales bacterium]
RGWSRSMSRPAAHAVAMTTKLVEYLPTVTQLYRRLQDSGIGQARTRDSGIGQPMSIKSERLE